MPGPRRMFTERLGEETESLELRAIEVEPADVGEAGEPTVVEGVKGTWRVDPSLLDQPFSGRAALLSPFDRLIHDRKRTVELFEFDYQLEMYKPAARRRWGYFALPILYGDQLVGKLDATADRKAGVLRVDAIHQDVPIDTTMTAAVESEIKDLARWLELDLTLPRASRLARAPLLCPEEGFEPASRLQTPGQWPPGQKELPGVMPPRGSPPHPQGAQEEGDEEHANAGEQQVQQALHDNAHDTQRHRHDHQQ